MSQFHPDLAEAASAYVGIIEQIERTSDSATLRHLDHQRVGLHWDFMDLLKQHRIEFRDRTHATEIAIYIARTS